MRLLFLAYFNFTPTGENRQTQTLQPRSRIAGPFLPLRRHGNLLRRLPRTVPEVVPSGLLHLVHSKVGAGDELLGILGVIGIDLFPQIAAALLFPGTDPAPAASCRPDLHLIPRRAASGETDPATRRDIKTDHKPKSKIIRFPYPGLSDIPARGRASGGEAAWLGAFPVI